MNRTKVLYTFLFFLITSFAVQAQDQIEIMPGGGRLKSGEKDGVKFMRLLQNVHLRQGETNLYSDSAHFYREQNRVEIYSNVRVVQGSLTITSATAFYNGNDQVANFMGGVNMRDDKMTLNTPTLYYNLATRTARYTQGGTIIESGNTVTSQYGNYNLNTKLLSFKGNVHVVSPDADIKSDTLQYNSATKMVFFVSQTRIVSGNQVLNAKGGSYNTITKESVFRDTKIETEDYFIEGNNTFYDSAKEYFYATGNVKLTSKDPKNKTIITGQTAQYWRNEGKSRVSGSPVMRSLVSGDTLFISADTLIAINHKDPKKKDFLYAHYDVRIYKSDLQGKCDSLSYNLTDSTMFLNHNPILWSNNSQLVSDRMEMRMKNKAIDKMFMYNNSFIISEDSIKNLNQIKGRDMTSFFENSKIRRVDVNGNGESIYFALEGDSVLTGMNKTICSDMILKFKDQKLQTISFLTNPDASFIPPHELKEPDKRLRGFKWRIEEKVTKPMVLAKRTNKSVNPAKPVRPVQALVPKNTKPVKPTRKERKNTK